MIVPKTRRRPPAPRPSAANRVAAIFRWGRRASRGLRDILGSVARKSWGLARREEGNAIVEFIGWSAVLVVPVLYFVISLAQIQATSFAVASAADAACAAATARGRRGAGSAGGRRRRRRGRRC